MQWPWQQCGLARGQNRLSSAHLPLCLRDPGRSLQPPAPGAHKPGTSAESRCLRGEAGARHLEPSELLFAIGNSVGSAQAPWSVTEVGLFTAALARIEMRRVARHGRRRVSRVGAGPWLAGPTAAVSVLLFPSFGLRQVLGWPWYGAARRACHRVGTVNRPHASITSSKPAHFVFVEQDQHQHRTRTRAQTQTRLRTRTDRSVGVNGLQAWVTAGWLGRCLAMVIAWLATGGSTRQRLPSGHRWAWGVKKPPLGGSNWSIRVFRFGSKRWRPIPLVQST